MQNRSMPRAVFDTDGDLASTRGELDRVRDEVGEDLKHPIVIELREEGAGGDLRREGDALLERGGLERLRRFRHQGGGVTLDGRHRELPGVDAGDVDEVADEPIHPRDVAPDAVAAAETCGSGSSSPAGAAAPG